MSGVGPISQDWEPIVIRKKAPNAAAKKDEKAVNAARRAGAEIETVKKGLCLLPLSSFVSRVKGGKSFVRTVTGRWGFWVGLGSVRDGSGFDLSRSRFRK
ncbi:hypothetical protein ACLB2K_059477 [Fragaria x ananassa]